MSDFVHLHVHTQYSILDGASKISTLISRAVEFGMPAIAITDHGNMFGVKEFFNEATSQGIKPIIGCEIYVASKSRFDKSDTEDRSGYHMILLAKNKTGYKNLIRLVSHAWTEGFYYKPRIDKELLFQYREGLIVTTACIAGEIAQAVLSGQSGKAEELVLEMKNMFHEDFYLEVSRHPTGNPRFDDDVLASQNIVAEAYKEFSSKFGVKIVATNDAHFIHSEDAEAHDRLLCLNTGKDLDDPSRMVYTKQEWFKSAEEMADLFRDIPEALAHTLEVEQKVELFNLNEDPILPDFPLPEGFSDENEYLRHLTYIGAEQRYAEITDEIRERIEFELDVIGGMGFPGYFLIVHDVIATARQMDVWVGPGRGSAAGSVVAYCIQITDVDPLKYDLLFERFLNPDRVSMPDIDIDFDEDGRQKVIDYVEQKYGHNRVAQIITFGTMAAKMAIRDVARVQKLPLPEADKLAKLVPERPGITLQKAFAEVKELADAKNAKNKLISETIKFAETLEGSVRHTGLHACGLIISRDDLIDHIPVCVSKDSNLLVTQFEGEHVESVGMLKMDFLGLKTLSIIRDAISNIKLSRGIEIDLENIPWDDTSTFELFSRGDTGGVFQFESDGMRKHLRELKPTHFEDLIAMNALYRPGPMDYIPNYIRRKHGKEKIEYDYPVMKEYLESTYGITVYQEQVMQLSRVMAGFTRGEADSLRKVIGKKHAENLPKLQARFFEGCLQNNIPEKTVKKIWADWESFAGYAFNKSHSTCYAYLAYKMAFLKAHYTAEFYAAVLSRNLSDIKNITLYIEESKRHDIPVLGPDVNESEKRFTVNKKGEIRFGLGAIKGVGESAVECIIEERSKNGEYQNIFDFAKRINLRTVNKRSFEAIAMAGAFDCFESAHRAQYFFSDKQDDPTFVEKLIRHVGMMQTRKNSMQASLFGEESDVSIADPEIPACDPWSKIDQLRNEKDVIGFYLSGHPLEQHALELENFTNITIVKLKTNLEKLKNREISLGGQVISAVHKVAKSGKDYGTFVLEDFTESITFNIFSDTYLRFKHLLSPGRFLLVKGKVDKRYNTEELELRINQIELLSEAVEKHTTEIRVFVYLDELQQEKSNMLITAIHENPGKCPVKLTVFDNQSGLELDLRPKLKRVDPAGFVNWLKTNKSFRFKLNNHHHAHATA